MDRLTRRGCIQGTLAALAGANSALPAFAAPEKKKPGKPGIKFAELYGSPRSRDVKLSKQIGVNYAIAGVGLSRVPPRAVRRRAPEAQGWFRRSRNSDRRCREPSRRRRENQTRRGRPRRGNRELQVGHRGAEQGRHQDDLLQLHGRTGLVPHPDESAGARRRPHQRVRYRGRKGPGKHPLGRSQRREDVGQHHLLRQGGDAGRRKIRGGDGPASRRSADFAAARHRAHPYQRPARIAASWTSSRAGSTASRTARRTSA